MDRFGRWSHQTDKGAVTRRRCRSFPPLAFPQLRQHSHCRGEPHVHPQRTTRPSTQSAHPRWSAVSTFTSRRLGFALHHVCPLNCIPHAFNDIGSPDGLVRSLGEDTSRRLRALCAIALALGRRAPGAALRFISAMTACRRVVTAGTRPHPPPNSAPALSRFIQNP